MTQKDDSGCMTVGDLSCLCFSTRSRFSTMNKYYFFKEKKDLQNVYLETCNQ